MSLQPSRRVAIYLRESLDLTGDRAAVERHGKECKRIITERDWDLVGTYEDNSVSSKKGVKRPGYERMMRDYSTRKFDAIVCWDLDRLTRVPRELEDMIDAAETGQLAIVTANGEADLTTDAGRLFARVKAAVARSEVERKSARQKLANDQRAESGMPYRCQRPFGYEPDGMQIRCSEADELRKAAEGVLAGNSLSSIVRDLNDRGVRTATGKTWRTTTLKAALISPRNAGMRRHRGQVIGEAAWPAVFDDTTATAVRAILTDPARSQRGPARRYLLSGVMTCGKCGGPVVGARLKPPKDYTVYRCTHLHLTRRSDPIDDLIVRLVIQRLCRPDAADLFARSDNTKDVAALRDQLRSARGRLNGLAEAFAMGEIDRQALAAGTKRLDQEIATMETRLATLVADPVIGRLIGEPDVADAFAAYPLDVQRQIVDSLMSVVLMPVGPGRRPDPRDSITFVWKDPE